MQIRRVLKQLGLTGFLSVWALPLVAAAQPDVTQDREQCRKAETAKECQAALPACERALAVLDKTLSDPELDAIRKRVLRETAKCEYEVGNYPAAEGLYRSELALLRRLQGPEHVEVASSLDNLAAVLESQGKYALAETLNRQALTMRQKLLGAAHPDVATSVNNLAGVLGQQGKYERAETLLRQVLATLQKRLGAEDPIVVASRNNLAVVLSEQGKYEPAEKLHRQVLAMRQRLFGADHLLVAASLNNLAAVLFCQGKYEPAAALHRQALAMKQKLLGAEHSDVATSLDNLAIALSNQGQYEPAEALYRQALAMKQKLLDVEHPDVARNINNLAFVLFRQGKYEPAETLLRQALAMWQKLLGAEHPDVATSLDNLAMVLFCQGKYEPAETLHRQALAMRQKLLGTEHPAVAYSLHNLAGVLSAKGKYEPAETLYRQALAIRQKVLGAKHPDVATSRNNLADVLSRQGKYQLAETLYRQALAMRQKRLGAEHPDVATSLNNLADVLMRRGQFLAALPLFTQAAQVREKLLRVTSSETRMRAVLSLVRGEEDTLYGLLLQQPTHQPLQRLALVTALLRKGRAAEAGTFANLLLHQSRGNRQLQERYEQWQQLRQQREVLLYGGGGKLSTADYRARLTELSQQADELESQLAAAMPELRKLQPPAFAAILPAVAARLPKDGVLVELVWAEPYNFTATGTEARRAAPHYIAMVLSADQHIAVHDLGEATSVDSQIQALLAALRDPATEPKRAAQTLYNQILKPLVPAAAKHLYLSLDGALNLLPFDALHDGSDYLLGRYRFHYLTSGRDLLRQSSRQTPGPALLVANPDFGKIDSSLQPAVRPSLYQGLAGLPRLPGTQREAELLSSLLGVTPLLNERAQEAAVRASRSPFILHIATHGLFMNDIDLPPSIDAEQGLRSFSVTREVRTKNVSAPETEFLPGEAGAMNRSALVLAGVAQGDRATSSAADGLLTAEEARSLELEGTQLVVLSACETGQGALSAGQGVYGLRRAFLVAGAETLVTSLWRVHDEATGELMGMYYRKLLDKRQPGDRLGAMQAAMQELRAQPGRSHPYYWAPFLVIGSDGPLRPPASLPQR